MSSEIKFRVWDDGHYSGITKMLYFTYDDIINFGLKCLNHKFLDDNVYCRPDDNQVMRWTGLVDKNKKEIYEFDIISKEGAFVLWDKQLACWCFNFKGNKTPNTPLFYGNNIKNSEVLGNTFETPELLVEEKPIL